MTTVQQNIFGIAPPATPADYYLPGAGTPAVSTCDYYFSGGLYWFRCYDLNSWGAPGQAIAAAKGYRYLWTITSDHPLESVNWLESYDFRFGFSNDPGILPDPATVYSVVPHNNSWNASSPSGLGTTNVNAYHVMWLVYNPDDASFPFYMYSEGAFSTSLVASEFTHVCTVQRSVDLITWTPYGISHFTDIDPNIQGWSSFQRVTRISTGNWVSVGLTGKASFQGATFVGGAVYTSTTGLLFDNTTAPTNEKAANLVAPNTVVAATFSMTANTNALSSNVNLWAAGDVGKIITIYGVNSSFGQLTTSILGFTDAKHITVNVGFDYDGSANSNNICDTTITNQAVVVEWETTITNFIGTTDYQGSAADNVTVSGQLYAVTTERTLYNTGGFYPAFAGEPMYVTLVPIDSNFNVLSSPAQIRLAAGVATYNSSFPTQFWLQDTNAYQEDGILHVYAIHGYPSQVDTLAPGLPFDETGGLRQQFADYYTYVYDATAAASAAPCGVSASCAAGTVTISWTNAVPGTTYNISRGTSAGSQPTSLGSTSSTSFTDTPGNGAQFWYKVANASGGKSRIVHAYVSSATAFVNQHINRVLDDGGDTTKINLSYLIAADAWLTANSLYSNLLYWADDRFGIKVVGGITKRYCLGSTKLPRGLDFTAGTTNSVYSSTALGGSLPGWVNSTSTAYGMWGVNTNDPNLGARFNQIRGKTQITVAALYQRTTTAANCALLGSSTSTSSGYGSPIPVPLYDGIGTGMSLLHGSGTPGTISFSLRDQPGLKTATATASANTITVAAGVFDGSNMWAYSDGTPGSPNGSLDPNLDLANDTFLAGACDLVGTGFKYPFLCSGSQASFYNAADGEVPYYPGVQSSFGVDPGQPPKRYFSTSEAQFNHGAFVVLDVGLSSTLVSSLTALLKSSFAGTGSPIPIKAKSKILAPAPV